MFVCYTQMYALKTNYIEQTKYCILYYAANSDKWKNGK